MQTPLVAVVTRTRDRPLLLTRARQSIAHQRFRQFQWILVNDGGEQSGVEREADAARKLGIDAQVLHVPTSRGMEAAANIGVRNSRSEYVAIHDDDDVWHPRFLTDTVAYLDANPDKVATVTRCETVYERLDEKGRATTVRKERYRPHLGAIHLADLARTNMFPPIALLFRRNVYEVVGGFDETMRVLGDWDFNLRIALQGDIGLLDLYRAQYHVRLEGKNGAAGPTVYDNTVTAARADHVQQEAAYRNRMIRHDVYNGRAGLGFLLALGRMQQSPPAPRQWRNLITRLLNRREQS